MSVLGRRGQGRVATNQPVNIWTGLQSEPDDVLLAVVLGLEPIPAKYEKALQAAPWGIPQIAKISGITEKELKDRCMQQLSHINAQGQLDNSTFAAETMALACNDLRYFITMNLTSKERKIIYWSYGFSISQIRTDEQLAKMYDSEISFVRASKLAINKLLFPQR